MQRDKLMKRLLLCCLTMFIILFLSDQTTAAPNAKKNGMQLGEDGEWHYYVDGMINTDFTGMVTEENSGRRYWFDSGIVARDKEAYDPVSDAWYWFDADGTMAVNKDVFIPINEERTAGKWVRYDENGGMVKGEDYRYGGWYWFDPITGEMRKGFVNIPDGTKEGKWVYYDEINGQMHHGESCISGNWYRFDEWTGKMTHGEYCNSEGNWYYYDEITGVMQKGSVYHHNNRYYYDEITGIMQKGIVNHDGKEYCYDEITGIFLGEFIEDIHIVGYIRNSLYTSTKYVTIYIKNSSDSDIHFGNFSGYGLGLFYENQDSESIHGFLYSGDWSHQVSGYRAASGSSGTMNFKLDATSYIGTESYVFLPFTYKGKQYYATIYTSSGKSYYIREDSLK